MSLRVFIREPMDFDPPLLVAQMVEGNAAEARALRPRQQHPNGDQAGGAPSKTRRSQTKELHVRVPIQNYQYLDQLACRYGMRSLASAVNFLIEYHRRKDSEAGKNGTPIAETDIG